MTYASSALAAGEAVWVALSDSGGAYAEAAEVVRRELLRSHAAPVVEVQPWQQLLAAGLPPPRLMIAIGSNAYVGLAESEVRAPLLATLLPRSTFDRHADKACRSGRACSTVYLDQPPARQVGLLHLAMPDRRRIGTLVGPDAKALAAQLHHAASERGLAFNAIEVGTGANLFPLLQEALNDSDVFLAIADSFVFNSYTIQNILTAAYRRRIPLVGFSPAYVKAGALLALYSTPAQIGTQVGEIGRGVLAGRPLPPPQAPREFTVGVNAEVARSLGFAIDVDAGGRWTEQLRARERLP